MRRYIHSNSDDPALLFIMHANLTCCIFLLVVPDRIYGYII